jgi:hypothetical protein
MLKRMNPMVVTALCGLALGLLAAPRVRSMRLLKAERRANVIFTARADANPVVVVFADDARTGMQMDGKAAQTFRDQFAAAEWSVMDNGQVSISKNGMHLLGAQYLANEGQTLFLLHRRAQQSIIDGEIGRDDTDPKHGFGRLVITQLDNDPRRSRTVRISVTLTFEA